MRQDSKPSEEYNTKLVSGKPAGIHQVLVFITGKPDHTRAQVTFGVVGPSRRSLDALTDSSDREVRFGNCVERAIIRSAKANISQRSNDGRSKNLAQ